MTILLFGILLPIISSIAGESVRYVLPYYSFVISVILVLLVYPYMKELAIKEIRPYKDSKPHPLKGLLYGVGAFLPIIIIELVYPFVVFEGQALMEIKPIILNVLMCPLYWIVELLGRSVAAYAVASAVVPVTAMLGYLGGYYGIDLGKYLGMKKQ
jgi:hypothetical protein